MRRTTRLEKQWDANLKAALARLPEDILPNVIGPRYPRWYVYLLADLSTDKAFYVGCTARPRRRLRDHVDDPNSAAYHRIREMRAKGEAPAMLISSIHEDRAHALETEAHLIATLPGLDNRTRG